MTTLNDFISSQIRTWVPIFVTFLVNILGTNGIIIPEEASAGLTAFLSALAGGLWYLAARLLETKVNPAFGWMIGLPKTPEYATNPAPKDIEDRELLDGDEVLD